jgi:hypothetical protein
MMNSGSSYTGLSPAVPFPGIAADLGPPVVGLGLAIAAAPAQAAGSLSFTRGEIILSN